MLQASAPSGGTTGSEQPVVMCVTDDEVNHMVLEGMLQSQDYRQVPAAVAAARP
jgi:hypothetical protein